MNRFFKYKLDHILFWTLTVFFHAFTRVGLIEKVGTLQFLFEIALRNSLLAMTIYLNLLVIIPWIEKNKKYALNAFLLLVSLCFYVAAKNAHDVYLYGYVIGDVERQGFYHNTLYNFSIVVFYLAFSVALHLSKQWYLQQELIRKIEVEKLNTELDYLKSQINPHFLFNSLNTIFFQIEKSNIPARDTLTKFSDMLRFQLYECNGKEIPLEKEINYLKNYVDLQRLRKDENYNIQFVVKGDPREFKIAPLLLIPFVENAFKHVSHFPDKTNNIIIHLEREGNFLCMTVENTKDRIQKENSGSRGIGLKNVQRRLELQYPERHSLAINETEQHFEVDLKIQMIP